MKSTVLKLLAIAFIAAALGGCGSMEMKPWISPYERNNLAEAHPEVVARMAEAIHAWRMVHPLSGTRHALEKFIFRRHRRLIAARRDV